MSSRRCTRSTERIQTWPNEPSPSGTAKACASSLDAAASPYAPSRNSRNVPARKPAVPARVQFHSTAVWHRELDMTGRTCTRIGALSYVTACGRNTAALQPWSGQPGAQPDARAPQRLRLGHQRLAPARSLMVSLTAHAARLPRKVLFDGRVLLSRGGCDEARQPVHGPSASQGLWLSAVRRLP
jgi:hypothetical protein